MRYRSATATTMIRSIPATDLTVTSLTPTPTGFTATFSKPVLNTTINPVHLYSATASNANFGPSDVTLVGKATGPVTGSAPHVCPESFGSLLRPSRLLTP